MPRWVILQVCYLYSPDKILGGKAARKGPRERVGLSRMLQVSTKKDPNIVEFN
jgi:hypothetical protein